MPNYYKYYNKNKGAQVILETGKCINKLQILSIELFDVIKRDVEKQLMKLVTLAKITVLGYCVPLLCNVESHCTLTISKLET